MKAKIRLATDGIIEKPFPVWLRELRKFFSQFQHELKIETTEKGGEITEVRIFGTVFKREKIKDENPA